MKAAHSGPAVGVWFLVFLSFVAPAAGRSDQPAPPDANDSQGPPAPDPADKEEKTGAARGAASAATGAQKKDSCPLGMEYLYTDCRGVFQPSFYGLSRRHVRGE